MIAATADIHADVELGPDSSIGPFCVLGIDPHDTMGQLRIGSGAVVRSHSVVYRDTRAGDGLHVGHGVLIRESTTIGENVSIGSHSVVEHHVTLGHRVRLHSNCFVPEYSILDDDVWLGPGVIVTNSRYPNRPDSKSKLDGVHLESGATVGAGAVLLPGIVIGAGALIGAGAVVVDDVPPGATVVGNPGRPTR